MFKQIRYGIALLGLLLSVFTTGTNAFTGCASSTKTAGSLAAPPCDVSFTVIPTFICGTVPQTGVYTIRNNAPVTIAINYIRIQNNDANPDSDVTIDSTTCGSSLAAGASCNITVSLNAVATFNRILQIGVNTRQVQLSSPVITGCTAPTPIPPSPSFPCALNTTSTYATLAGSTITNTGPTLLAGDLGLSPGTAVIGFPPGVVTGTQHITDAAAAQAQLDLTTLYNCLAAQPCGTTIGTADQAGVTLTSSGVGAVNVYCSGSSILNSGVLTLSGDSTSVFIFQAGSTLTLNPGATIVLTGGATAANVFWQVGSSATLGTTTAFQGTIAAFTSITMNNAATMIGRALALNAAVTFDTNIVTLP
jgi:hypothetical protein